MRFQVDFGLATLPSETGLPFIRGACGPRDNDRGLPARRYSTELKEWEVLAGYLASTTVQGPQGLLSKGVYSDAALSSTLRVVPTP